jgi:hypothetical protein
MDDDANADDSDGEPNEDKTFNVGNIRDIDNTTVNKIKKEKKSRAAVGSQQWTEREYLLASRSWIKTTTEMMGIKANMATFDTQWAEYYNKMRDAQADVETMVSIVLLS